MRRSAPGRAGLVSPPTARFTASGADQFRWLGDHVNKCPVAKRRDREGAPDGLGEHQPLQGLGAIHGLPARVEPAGRQREARSVSWSARYHLDHPDAPA